MFQHLKIFSERCGPKTLKPMDIIQLEWEQVICPKFPILSCAPSSSHFFCFKPWETGCGRHWQFYHLHTNRKSFFQKQIGLIKLVVANRKLQPSLPLLPKVPQTLCPASTSPHIPACLLAAFGWAGCMVFSFPGRHQQGRKVSAPLLGRGKRKP